MPSTAPPPWPASCAPLELLAGAERRRGRREGARVKITPQQRELDKQLARQAEHAHSRLVAASQASGPTKAGAGAAAGARIIKAVVGIGLLLGGPTGYAINPGSIE
jgi:hypothetical protein